MTTTTTTRDATTTSPSPPADRTESAVTTPATAVGLSPTHPHRTVTNPTLAERTRRAVGRRTGRLRLALLAFVLFLPLLATAVLGAR